MMTRLPILVLTTALLLSCGDSTGSNDDDSGALDDDDTGGGNIVTFTVYTDAACTELPPMNSVVELDATEACNATPDASISDLVCHTDRITYTNHPNNKDCSSSGIGNELFVGVCQQFPGPVATWKLIEIDSYNCLTESS